MFKIINEHETENIQFTTVKLQDKLEITFCNLGASIYKIACIDKFSHWADITVTPFSKKNWLENRTYSGAIIGPLAGRYSTEHTFLEQNRPPLHVHGGAHGWDKIIWKQTISQNKSQIILSFHYTNLSQSIKIRYTLSVKGQLKMEIYATSKTDSFINPTNHVYFNLNGDPYLPITNHLLFLAADYYYAEDENHLIQSIINVPRNGELDFQTLASLEKISSIGGLNTTYKFLSKNGKGTLLHPTNGRRIDFETTLPAVVMYTFNQPQTFFSKDEQLYPIYAGITFETQYPANQLELVSFNRNHPYYAQTCFTFTVE